MAKVQDEMRTSRQWLARWCLVGVVIVGSTTTLPGQVYFHRPGVVRHPGVGWWGFNFDTGFIGGTPAESYARGQAELMRAQGEFNQASAAAAVNVEQARSLYLQNRQQWEQIQAQRAQATLQRRAEEAASARALRERRAAMAAQQPPTAAISAPLYDETTGAVDWPEVLELAQFEALRVTLEHQFQTKVHTGGSGGVNQQILETATELRNQLRSQIRTLPPSGYMEARRFLDRLIDDVRSQIG